MRACPRLLCSFRLFSQLLPCVASNRASGGRRPADIPSGIRGGRYFGLAVTHQAVRSSALVWGKLAEETLCFAGRLDHSRAARSFCQGTGIGQSAADEGRVVMQSVRIKCRGDIADGLVESLLCFGASSCSIEDAHRGDPREQELYSDGPVPWHAGQRQLWEQSHITAIFPVQQDVGEAIAMASHAIGFNEMPHYEIDLVEDQDWIEQLQSMFEPVEVAAGLWIVPKWRVPPNPGAVNVILDPGLAFGTGEHPTTRLCLQWLNLVVRGGERVMDYGIGSGILAIAALKMGAVRAVGVDVDPMALSSATHNASLNTLEEDHLQVFLSDMNGADPVPVGAAYHPVSENYMEEDEDNRGCSDFDIVIANILANPLIDLSQRITGYAKPGGLVGLSGLLVEQVDQVRNTYSYFLDNIQVTQDSGWACISGVRKLSQGM